MARTLHGLCALECSPQSLCRTWGFCGRCSEGSWYCGKSSLKVESLNESQLLLQMLVSKSQYTWLQWPKFCHNTVVLPQCEETQGCNDNITVWDLLLPEAPLPCLPPCPAHFTETSAEAGETAVIVNMATSLSASPAPKENNSPDLIDATGLWKVAQQAVSTRYCKLSQGNREFSHHSGCPGQKQLSF